MLFRSDVNNAGVFLARADENLRRLGGERLEQRARVFVAAMLAPHHGKDAQLGVARRAAEDFHGVGVFFRREVVLRDEFECDGGFGHEKNLIHLNFATRASISGRISIPI